MIYNSIELTRAVGGFSPHEVVYAERMRIQSALSRERKLVLHMEVLIQNRAG